MVGSGNESAVGVKWTARTNNWKFEIFPPGNISKSGRNRPYFGHETINPNWGPERPVSKNRPILGRFLAPCKFCPFFGRLKIDQNGQNFNPRVFMWLFICANLKKKFTDFFSVVPFLDNIFDLIWRCLVRSPGQNQGISVRGQKMVIWCRSGCSKKSVIFIIILGPKFNRFKANPWMFGLEECPFLAPKKMSYFWQIFCNFWNFWNV